MRFLGIDLGTASLKLATVDEDGHERAFASAAYGSPWMNPSARAGWLGLGPGDTRGTMMRAVFEGVAFAWSWRWIWRHWRRRKHGWHRRVTMQIWRIVIRVSSIYTSVTRTGFNAPFRPPLTLTLAQANPRESTRIHETARTASYEICPIQPRPRLHIPTFARVSSCSITHCGP